MSRSMSRGDWFNMMNILLVSGGVLFFAVAVRDCADRNDPRAQAQSGLERLYGPEVRVACFNTGGPAVACLLRMPDGQMRSVRCDYSGGCKEGPR